MRDLNELTKKRLIDKIKDIDPVYGSEYDSSPVCIGCYADEIGGSLQHTGACLWEYLNDIKRGKGK